MWRGQYNKYTKFVYVIDILNSSFASTPYVVLSP